MPYADKKKQREAEKESSQRVYSDALTVKIRHDSGMHEPLHNAAAALSLSVSQYMIWAAKETLIRDGYMKPDEPKKED